jgi:acetyltransferase-like isoleucine patch superfamily enzyme
MPASVVRAETSVVHAGVTLGERCRIEEYAILGLPPSGYGPGDLATMIGSDALIRSHTVIYAGCDIGTGLRTGHGALVREMGRLGDDVSVGSHSIVEHHVRIGDRVRIHSQAFIPEYCEVEDDAWIGPHVVLTNARYPHGTRTKESLEGVRILRGAMIGANSTILPGLVVGAGALVGAGSVVVRDVPEGMVVAGNPARVIRPVDEIEAYR